MCLVLWNLFVLLSTTALAVYHTMKWKDTGIPRHAFWVGIMIMCVIINIKLFV